MFAIDWLRGGIPVETETSVLTNEAAAVAGARAQTAEVARRHPGREPDSFLLMDPAGKILGIFPVVSP
jgi:hypothetical protein